MKTGLKCTQEFVVPMPLGLHLRPAAMLAKTAGRFRSDITVKRDRSKANGKSLMSIVMLEAAFGAVLIVAAEGHDAADAMAAIAALFATRFRD